MKDDASEVLSLNPVQHLDVEVWMPTEAMTRVRDLVPRGYWDPIAAEEYVTAPGT
jgi:CO dehydrogenase/acetyl-CoA synthase beta subunit